MAKFDAADRQASGEPVPEEIQRLLGNLIASATSSGEVLDIYEAAGMPKPSLDDLTPEFIAKTQQARNPQLAIEALRKLIADESAKTTRNNVIRQRAFSERITELMKKYTNQQLTSAEVIAELVELAREVAAEGNRGAQFTPPLNSDELAFYDAVASNESAVEVQGEGVLADIARRAGVRDAARRAHRLDRPRRRPGQAALLDQTASGPLRLPAGQAARGDQAGHGTDGIHGTAVCRGTGLAHGAITFDLDRALPAVTAMSPRNHVKMRA